MFLFVPNFFSAAAQGSEVAAVADGFYTGGAPDVQSRKSRRIRWGRGRGDWDKGAGLLLVQEVHWGGGSGHPRCGGG